MNIQIIFRLFFGVLVAASAAVCLAQTASNPYRKVALVIGNSEYGKNRLPNPERDAQAIAESLSEIGFEVTTKFNRGQHDLERDIDEVTKGLKRGDTIFVFYAGHGIEVENQNYMIPVDADITRPYHVNQRCVSVGYALEAMHDSGASLKVLILDACRDNPFRNFVRSTALGLAAIEAPEGTIVAFSTAPGKVALDGEGENSPFTKHLVATLRSHPEQGLEVNAMFTTVARAVKKETGQTSYVNSDRSMDPYHLKQPRKPLQQQIVEPSFQEVLSAIVKAVSERPEIPDICGFVDVFPDYRALLSGLNGQQKHLVQGTPICFPSEEVWKNNSRLRADIIRVLRQHNVLSANSQNASNRIAKLMTSKEPTFGETFRAAQEYIKRINRDVCGLKELVPGYRELIDQLAPSEKYQVKVFPDLPGLAICFPSEETWNSKPQMRSTVIEVLRNAYVIDF